MPHNNRTHKQLHRPDPLKGHLPLTRSLIQAELMPELVFGDGVGMVDLVAEHEERHARELLHGEEGVELGFALGETLEVLGVDHEDDAAYFGEVVFPEATGCCFFHPRLAKTFFLFFFWEGGEYPAGDRPDQKW